MPVRRHLEVKSSNVKAVGYDPEERVLEIVFQTDPLLVYKYPDFPARTYVELLNAESVGAFFTVNVRKVYTTFEKVRLPPPPSVDSPEKIAQALGLRTGTVKIGTVKDSTKDRK